MKYESIQDWLHDSLLVSFKCGASSRHGSKIINNRISETKAS